MTVRKLTWRRDLPDARDLCLKVTRFRKLPSKVDLRSFCSSVEDQGEIGSCSAQAFVAVMEYLDRKGDDKWTDLSRLFVYYNSRTNPADDEGAYLRDGIKALSKYGAPDEAIWPYDVNLYATKPPKAAYDDGVKRCISEYRRVESLRGVQQSLADGYPVVFGFSVYDSFDSIGADGIMPMPNLDVEKNQGGHAVVAVGYDDYKGHLIVRNSWGPEWGSSGNFFMPYEYIKAGLAADFWSIIRFPIPKMDGAVDINTPDVKWYIPITGIWGFIKSIFNRKGD